MVPGPVWSPSVEICLEERPAPFVDVPTAVVEPVVDVRFLRSTQQPVPSRSGFHSQRVSTLGEALAKLARDQHEASTTGHSADEPLKASLNQPSEASNQPSEAPNQPSEAPNKPSEASDRPSPTTAPAGDPQPAERPAKKASERRAYPRRQSRCAVRLAARDQPGPVRDWAFHAEQRGDVLDLSLSSVAFLYDRAFPLDMRIVARLTRDFVTEHLDIEGTIVRCEPQESRYHIVVALDHRLDLADVERYGRPLEDASFV